MASLSRAWQATLRDRSGVPEAPQRLSCLLVCLRSAEPSACLVAFPAMPRCATPCPGTTPFVTHSVWWTGSRGVRPELQHHGQARSAPYEKASARLIARHDIANCMDKSSTDGLRTVARPTKNVVDGLDSTAVRSRITCVGAGRDCHEAPESEPPRGRSTHTLEPPMPSNNGLTWQRHACTCRQQMVTHSRGLGAPAVVSSASHAVLLWYMSSAPSTWEVNTDSDVRKQEHHGRSLPRVRLAKWLSSFSLAQGVVGLGSEDRWLQRRGKAGRLSRMVSSTV